jgi:hypothetical protein
MSFNNNVRNDNEEDNELVALRMAALQSMHNKNKSINNKQNEDSDHKRRTNNNNNHLNKSNYYSRNGSKRSNLIVLTASESEVVSNNKSQNLINKLINESSELPLKRKRVLPGRFSRLEKDDNTDEESDDFSDDNEDIDSNDNKFRAFNDDLLWPESDNNTNDVISDNDFNNQVITDLSLTIDNNCNDRDSNDCKITVNNDNNCLNNRNQINSCDEELDKDLCLSSASDKVIDSYTKIKSDKIKLNNNKITGFDILERRKQKFGDSADHQIITTNDSNGVESNESSISHYSNSNSKLSIKQRLSTNSIQNEKKPFLKKCRHRINSNSKLLNMSSKGDEKSFNTRTNRQLESEEFDDIDSHSSKKKLRSFVVMKTE